MTLSRRILSILVISLFTIGLWAQETGKADVFSDEFQGSWTASKTTYNKSEFVAAHKSYEFGTILKIMVEGEDRAVNVRVVDRGPFKFGYIVTLSRAAATELGLKDDDQRNVTIFVSKEQGLAATPTPQTYTQPAQVVASAPAVVNTPVGTSPTVVQPTEVMTSKGQSTNVEVGTTYSTVNTTAAVNKPTIIQNTTTSTTRVMSSNIGYGLQVGSFLDYNNAMLEMSKLQNNNINNLVLNSVYNNAGQTVYKLIIGPFADRVEVEQYKAIEPGKYDRKAFIVDLSKMK